MSRSLATKYKTYKFDGAPFFFYIDVIPIDLSQYEFLNHLKLLKGSANNSIMPLPLRVDRVFNGESSIMIRPKEPVSFTIDDNLVAVVNPSPFVRCGVEKLIIFTEIRSSEEFTLSLSPKNAKRWWDVTRYLYGRLFDLEEDFAAILRAYLHTLIRAKVNEDDLTKAAVTYCELIRDLCYKRIENKEVLVQVKEKEKLVNLYKKRDIKFLKKFKRIKEDVIDPGLIDIEIFDTRETGFKRIESSLDSFDKKDSKILKYLPLLFYDDLLECMLQNLKKLKESNTEILDPSYLIDQEVILLIETDELQRTDLSKYSWLREFNEINLDFILETISPTFL